MTLNSELVELRGGLIVRAAALALAVDLERRGFLMQNHDGKLVITGSATDGIYLTEIDCQNIRTHKIHLLAIVDYHPCFV